METKPDGSSPAPPEPQAPAKASPRRRWHRGLVFSLFTYLVGLLAVLGIALGALGWLFTTEAGTAWLLQRVPVVQISGTQGALFGDFAAQSVDLPLPGDGARLRLQELRWRRPQLQPGGLRQWFRIRLEELHVGRVDLQLSGTPSTGSTPPQSLALPFGLDIASARIDALHIDGQDTPVRDLRARIGLGIEDGALHRVDDLQASWDRLRASGQLQVATHDGLPLQAKLDIEQQLPGQNGWQATLALAGPLAAPGLEGQLRAGGTGQRPAQTLVVKAQLKPFADWPLGELQASARGLDLSALHSAAPVTALDLDAQVQSQAADLPAQAKLQLNNRAAGRWNEGRVPVRALQLELSGRPDNPSQLELKTFDATLGGAAAAAGRIGGQGRWSPSGWQLSLRLLGLMPSQLDARAPAMRLDGPLQIDGSGFDAGNPDAIQLQLRGQLEGRLLERGPDRAVQLRLNADINPLRIELRELLAQAGGAQAALNGRLQRSSRAAGWALSGQARLQDFDPLPWWPGREDSPWRQGPHRLNGDASFNLNLPVAAGTGSALQQLARLRGTAQLNLLPSQLAGVPVSGNLALHSDAPSLGNAQLQLDADGNRLTLEAKLGSAEGGTDDRWRLKAEMPALKRLQPLWRLLLDDPTEAQLGGALQAQAQLSGRWPAVHSDGTLQASELQLGSARAKTTSLRWLFGSQADAPLDVSLDVAQLSIGQPSAETLQLQLKGTLAAHMLELHADAKALPPLWVEKVQPAPAAATRTLARLQLQGGTIGTGPRGPSGWRGQVTALELRGNVAGAPAWIGSSAFDAELQWADGPLRLSLGAGRATLLGAALSWSRIAWSAADAGRAPALIEAQAQLEPLDVAPLLARVQPGFGWGGDLRIAGHVKVRSAPNFSADIVVERSGGDLSVTDEAGTRWLGLSDMRLGLVASDGVWSFSTGLAGKTLGQAAGAVVARTSPKATWPAADAPIEGVLELRINDVGVWGPWLPPGWRLTGTMHANASLSGRFGAPEYVGELAGSDLGVRNVLQGVEVRDGSASIVLLGDNARIDHFTARAGDGGLSLSGGASLGATPTAQLNLRLDEFQLLGRVDRRVVTSGEATLKLGRDTLVLDGDVKIDEGLIDFSRSEAPALSADVQVVRADTQVVDPVGAAIKDVGGAASTRKATLDLRVDLGTKLRVRGQGLDTGLRGQLRLTAPAGRLRVDGSVRTVDGTYRAYRQRLSIERGVLTFNGPVENPQLDIEAVRPNLDVRVGVAVTGTVLVPRVRLFSEPEMSDADKLSWLLRGRASEGQGTADTALLQAAALALLSGNEPGVLDQLLNVVGLDDLSLRQSDSAAGGAIFSVGKQLSRNWYVGYERGLNATAGNWQLIYRIAQRFTVRAQSGEQNSIELIWSWRWN